MPPSQGALPSAGRGNFWNPYVGGRGCGSNPGRSYNECFPNSATPQGNHPVCQLCSRRGHYASRCYQRFNIDFLGFVAQPADKSTSSMNALIPSLEMVNDSSWYSDSGAINHCTNNDQNLLSKSSYSGSDQLHVSDGSGLSISNIGKSAIQSLCSSKP